MPDGKSRVTLSANPWLNRRLVNASANSWRFSPLCQVPRAEIASVRDIPGDQGGEVYGTEQLRDTVYIANFIFTRCTTICPMTTAEMRKLQALAHVERNRRPEQEVPRG